MYPATTGPYINIGGLAVILQLLPPQRNAKHFAPEMSSSSLRKQKCNYCIVSCYNAYRNTEKNDRQLTVFSVIL